MILTLLVVAFVVYLVGEFVTFADRTCASRILRPTAWPGRAMPTPSGITEPNSTISTDGLRPSPSTTADADGMFSVRVGLVAGANVITLVANDPLTGRD